MYEFYNDIFVQENEKAKAFQEVCKNFRPVMHYFFLERFLHACDWFEKGLLTHEVWQLVQWWVTLLDSEIDTMNILIDQATAEVVHTDLGVAFEHGLMLKTPERVPFRLTRHIMLRGNSLCYADKSRSILTTLEVLMHDPLYKWALSPLKASTSEEGGGGGLSLPIPKAGITTSSVYAADLCSMANLSTLRMSSILRTPRPGLVTFDPHKYENLSFTRQGTSIGLNKGDLRNALHLRQNLLRTAISVLTWKAEDLDQAICYELYACASHMQGNLHVWFWPGFPFGSGFKLSSQIITFEHEGNWSKALEYYDLQGRSEPIVPASNFFPENSLRREHCSFPLTEDEMTIRKPYKGLIRSLQQLGCTHVLDLYSQGLTSRKGRFQHDFKFTELQVLFETNISAWSAGNWDISLLYDGALCGNPSPKLELIILMKIYMVVYGNCKRGDAKFFYLKLKDAKQELLFSIYHASEESTEYITQQSSNADLLPTEDDLAMADDLDQPIFYELYACAPEVLAKINIGSGFKISDPLLYEMEYCIVEAVLNEKIEKLLLSDVLFKSAHLSNIIYSSHMTSCLRAVQEGVAKDFNLKLQSRNSFSLCTMLVKRAQSTFTQQSSNCRYFIILGWHGVYASDHLYLKRWSIILRDSNCHLNL
ncbi:hypothetical protein POM88_035801 [Heracleum sosnowskyi]|uniref:PI3K/PI4K catalytic domain-containing protein n=1 Tax=Heracleum sosnowskyi TaxID=360622 RepID=A0AAD8MEE7_9APIA|nr:hypothetical protein POM88_035801 [Heracleum sosnowskyi]